MLVRSFVLLVTIVICCYGADVLLIRHGRSRVRHSTELRWGLKALDNLTLDYDDGPEINGTETNTTMFPTENISSSSSSSSSSTLLDNIETTKMVTKLVIGKKKVRKKEIMQNIKKNVDKGIEYLRTHASEVDATMSMIDMRMKRGPESTTSTSTASTSSSSSTTTTENIKKFTEELVPQKLNESQNDSPNEMNSNSNKIELSQFKSSDAQDEEDYAEHLNDEGAEFNLNEIDLTNVDGENDANAIFDVEEELELEGLDDISRANRRSLSKGKDVVTTFLRIVESQHLLGANCTAGTALNLGEGVVDRYAQDRFRVEAEIAVNRANMLTR